MQSVMVDIETWGKGPHAMIVAIGAVKFDPTGPLGHGLDQFYVAIDPRKDNNVGIMDAKTMMFWMDPKQNEAREWWFKEIEAYGDATVDIYSALQGFTDWYGKKSMPTWGNGAGFDPVILESSFNRAALEPPWDFRDVRCYRTFKATVPDDLSKHINNKLNTDFGPGGHHALRDAQWQARFMIEANHHQRGTACL